MSRNPFLVEEPEKKTSFLSALWDHVVRAMKERVGLHNNHIRISGSGAVEITDFSPIFRELKRIRPSIELAQKLSERQRVKNKSRSAAFNDAVKIARTRARNRETRINGAYQKATNGRHIG